MKVHELISILEDVDGDSVVILGEPGQAVVCSGADLEHFSKRDRVLPEGVDSWVSVIRLV